MSLFKNICRNCRDSKISNDLSVIISLNSDYETDLTSTINLLKDIQSETMTMNKIFNVKTRSSIIDWMILIRNKLFLRDETLFLSIDILDKMIFFYKGKLLKDDIHLIGLVSMFIASKYEEIYPFPLELFISKIGHNKYSKIEILKTERVILKKLGFQMPKNYFIQMLDLIMLKINKTKRELCRCYSTFYTYALNLYKLSLYDFKLTNYITRHTLFHSIFYYSLENCKFTEYDKIELKDVLLGKLKLTEMNRIKGTFLTLDMNYKMLKPKDKATILPSVYSYSRYPSIESVQS